MTVISAGVKSILDIGLTLEYLETQGVCVASYGDSRKAKLYFNKPQLFFCYLSIRGMANDLE